MPAMPHACPMNGNGIVLGSQRERREVRRDEEEDTAEDTRIRMRRILQAQPRAIYINRPPGR